MPRARRIKYGFFLNEKLAELDFSIRSLFQGLWLLADREGKLEDRPKKIHALLFPYDHELDIDADLDALQNASFLRRYKIGDASYIKILNFLTHQNPHRDETASVIPDPVTQKHVQSTTNNRLNIPCSLYPVPCKEKEIKEKEKEIKKKKGEDLCRKFEQFYEAYPIHKDKQRAWLAFEKINPDDQLFAAMLKAIENQKKEKEFKILANEFTPEWKYPPTWLNKKCWTDEIDLSAIKKEELKKSPYTACRRCGKEILKTLGLGGYCEPCVRIVYPR